MPHMLRAADASFRDAYRALIARRGARLDTAERDARAIVEDVRQRGLDAVLDASARFDGVRIERQALRVSADQISRARAACGGKLVAALERAAERIHAFHVRQTPADARWTDDTGVTLGWRWTPVDSVGLYAPGGLAAYPSSVLMNAVPAKAAGVKRLAMATPPGRLESNPAILAAADIAGVDEIWAIGGAQAIAALAYGAGDLAPCDMIVGPGNAYVAAAKKIVFGDVGIDSIAGPSEVFILCDGDAPADWIAADLMAQAEHDADAQSVLFTPSPTFADEVNAAVERILPTLSESAQRSWSTHGAVILVPDLETAAALCNEAAPEHVQIVAQDGERLERLIRHAGAIFLGSRTPEALGDYIAGPSHVLPTTRAARYASGVNVLTFMKRTTLISADAKALLALGDQAAAIADAEGLPAHALSLRKRLEP
ncbi:MAG: histidinol dehydrogenase [Alphaproteobacteria bacterium]|nr:histidinol dehydrogenase [Alphaproteobacteria bacterium]